MVCLFWIRQLYALDGRNGEKWEYGSFGILLLRLGWMARFFGGEDQSFTLWMEKAGKRNELPYRTTQLLYSWVELMVRFILDRTIQNLCLDLDGFQKMEHYGGIRGAAAIGANGMVCFGSNDNKVYAVRGSSPLASPWPPTARI